MIEQGNTLLSLKVVGQEIVGRGEDFADLVRQRLVDLRDDAS